MAKAADQFRSSDITIWAVAALAIWALAVLLANISALVPPNVYAALHASRLDGVTAGQLRDRIVALEAEARRIKEENDLLLQRVTVSQHTEIDTLRRIGLVEASLPDLAEKIAALAQPVDSGITASIGERGTQTFEVEGGSMTVTRRPLEPIVVGSAVTAAEPLPIAPLVLPDPEAFGIALGEPLHPDDAETRWQGLSARVGLLLIGMTPLLQDVADGSAQRLVAGPVASEAQARDLCGRMDRVGIPCDPVRFTGQTLPTLD